MVIVLCESELVLVSLGALRIYTRSSKNFGPGGQTTSRLDPRSQPERNSDIGPTRGASAWSPDFLNGRKPYILGRSFVLARCPFMADTCPL